MDREQHVVPLGGEPIGQEPEVADRVDVPAGAAMPGPDEPAELSQAERVWVADLDSGAGRTQRRDRLPGREARSFAQDDPHGDPEASQLAGLEAVPEGESANSVGEGTLSQVTAIRSNPWASRGLRRQGACDAAQVLTSPFRRSVLDQSFTFRRTGGGAVPVPGPGSIDQNDEGRNQDRPNEERVEQDAQPQRKTQLAE